MKNGSISIKVGFEKGIIKNTYLYTGAGLDFIYERMFENTFKSIKRNSKKVETGIKLIIFGVFFAHCWCCHQQ